MRFARPTDRLREVLRFYEGGLGFARIGSFEDHAGYSGVMLFWTRTAGASCSAA